MCVVSRAQRSTKWCAADPGSLRTPRLQRSRISGAPLRFAARCTASGTRAHLRASFTPVLHLRRAGPARLRPRCAPVRRPQRRNSRRKTAPAPCAPPPRRRSAAQRAPRWPTGSRRPPGHRGADTASLPPSAASASAGPRPSIQVVARARLSTASASRTAVQPKAGSLLACSASTMPRNSLICAATAAPPDSGSLRVTRSMA